ncbi:hypothetical protein [Rhizobium phage RHph_X2_26]|nr:hypothetical protein [Rhizobium phage RHph_X2_26]
MSIEQDLYIWRATVPRRTHFETVDERRAHYALFREHVAKCRAVSLPTSKCFTSEFEARQWAKQAEALADVPFEVFKHDYF